MNTVSYKSLHNIEHSAILRSKTKLLFFACIGHCLELYDHAIYGVMIPFLTFHFFPSDNSMTSLFFAFLSFTLAFIISPLGSLFWGWYSDTFGRLSMLRNTMLIMALPSLGIALLPTYDSIGLLAPIFLILFRMIQSLSASGEIIGARIFIMENLEQHENGFASGMTTAVGALGVLLAMGMGYLCSFYQDIENFWRIPFLVGSTLFIAGQLIRKKLLPQIESPLPNHSSSGLKGTFMILKSHPTNSLIVFLLGAILGIMSYFMHAFINPYLIGQGLPKALVFQYSIIGLICTLVVALFCGYHADKHKKVYQNLFIVMLAYGILSLPLFIFIQHGGWQTLICYMGLASLLGAYVCLSGIIMYRVFSPQTRCRGILFNYALGCATFGSLTPLTLNFLSHIHPYLPGWALSFFGLLSLVTVNRYIKHLQRRGMPASEMIFK